MVQKVPGQHVLAARTESPFPHPQPHPHPHPNPHSLVSRAVLWQAGLLRRPLSRRASVPEHGVGFALKVGPMLEGQAALATDVRHEPQDPEAVTQNRHSKDPEEP
jgi:hypothetical protein